MFFEEAQFPWAYTYRDYVIRAFNEDKRYDQFLLEQIAADRIDLGDDPSPLAALGFLTIGGRFMNNVHDVLDDRIDVVTRGLMGLTVTCARCHDHKYDPVSMKDYYGLYGIFASSTEPMVPPLVAKPPATEEYAKFDKELKDREKKLTDFVRSKHEELTAGARKRVAEYLVAAQGQLDQPSTEDFMLIADTNDVNPTMTIRWVKWLQRKQRSHDAVFSPWFAFAAGEKGKEPRAAEILERISKEGMPVNAILAKALREVDPNTLVDWSKVYAKVLHAVEEKRLKINAAMMEDPAEEELRLVFWGPEAPPNLTLLPYGDLSLLPDRASQGKLRELQGTLEKWRSAGAGAPPRAMALADSKTPFEPYVFIRGNPNQRGEDIPRKTPSWWSRKAGKPIADGGRLELAESIIDPANPLTARVLVNRVWMHHFGAGLVATPGDFGLRSDPPSHPELLNYLARRFMDEGWSIKKLHRQIVLSSTYQQRSDDRPEASKVDPENRLLWKFNRQRLDFEATRDALLAVAGRLDKKVGGQSVGNGFSPGANRRTLYAHLDRLNVPGLFRTFDFPSPDATSPQRSQTTVAPQSLFMMNHPLPMECAAHVAQRPDVVAGKSDTEKIERIHRLLFGRSPAPEELLLGRQYVQAEGTQAWRRYVHALMQTNEFVFVD
ncbi:MAG: DUF1549 and DUF1553 domain-containing protein [Gemmataceae bacterium]|nr:DUF1549 and DUF1553 domain-containing protein [Gemmataceae bacterium]